MLKKHKLGEIGKSLSEKEILKFSKKVPFYIDRMNNFKKKFYIKNWMDVIDSILDNLIKHLI